MPDDVQIKHFPLETGLDNSWFVIQSKDDDRFRRFDGSDLAGSGADDTCDENFIAGNCSSHTNNGRYSTIAGGESGSNSALDGFLGAGSGNTLTSDAEYGAVLVGLNNINKGTYSTILGGENGYIESTAPHAFLGAGKGNRTTGSFSFCGAGENNIIGDFGDHGAIVAGLNNKVHSNFAIVLAGELNEAGGQYSMAHGFQAKARSVGSVVLNDSRDKVTEDSGVNTLVLDFENGVYFNHPFYLPDGTELSGSNDLGGGDVTQNEYNELSGFARDEDATISGFVRSEDTIISGFARDEVNTLSGELQTQINNTTGVDVELTYGSEEVDQSLDDNSGVFVDVSGLELTLNDAGREYLVSSILTINNEVNSVTQVKARFESGVGSFEPITNSERNIRLPDNNSITQQLMLRHRMKVPSDQTSANVKVTVAHFDNPGDASINSDECSIDFVG